MCAPFAPLRFSRESGQGIAALSGAPPIPGKLYPVPILHPSLGQSSHEFFGIQDPLDSKYSASRLVTSGQQCGQHWSTFAEKYLCIYPQFNSCYFENFVSISRKVLMTHKVLFSLVHPMFI